MTAAGHGACVLPGLGLQVHTDLCSRDCTGFQVFLAATHSSTKPCRDGLVGPVLLKAGGCTRCARSLAALIAQDSLLVAPLVSQPWGH